MIVRRVFLCVGNGIREDGNLGNINTKIVDSALHGFANEKSKKGCVLMFSGGYKNKDGLTEAEAMREFALCKGFDFFDYVFIESKSYRTHNNAIRALGLISSYYLAKDTTIHLIDHPRHIKRTKFVFDVVNRLRHRNIFHIVPQPVEEVYDANIFGQPYWASRETWVPRERRMVFLYHLLLFRPWARLGLWILETVWPSEKQ